MASSVHNTVLWPYPPMYYCDRLHLGNVLHVSIFHNSNYWQKNLTKNRTRGFGFSDARSQCIASFCPLGFFFSANYADTGSGLVQCAICKEQAHSTLLCKLALHETPNIRGNILAKVHCSPMFTSTKHNRDSKKCQQAQNIFAHTQAHCTRRTARQAQAHTHKNTCSTHKHLCSTVHKNKHTHTST